MEAPFYRAHYDFVLKPAAASAQRSKAEALTD
jgi:hypothetical protein